MQKTKKSDLDLYNVYPNNSGASNMTTNPSSSVQAVTSNIFPPDTFTVSEANTGIVADTLYRIIDEIHDVRSSHTIPINFL